MHTLALNTDFQATKKLKLNAGITYTKADDSWDWVFTVRDPVLAFGGPNEGDPLATNGDNAPGMYASVDYDDYNNNNKIAGYSDLSYEQFELTAGGTYNFTDTFYTTVTATYDIFRSHNKSVYDEDYVYGDEDGTAYYGYVGLGWNF